MEPSFRDFTNLKREKFNDEKIWTVTSREQMTTEQIVEKCFDRFEQLKCLDASLPHIHREQHIKYLEKSLRGLSSSYECLDSSRPWLIYWILNSAHLLNFRFGVDVLDNTINFLEKCRDRDGGFGGGPQQKPHLAPTYAAVNSLCIIGSDKAMRAIDRDSLKKFLWSVREDNGAFRLHVDGEIDVRGAYCALSCAKLTNFSQKDEEELFANTAEWICSCQTYEGGFGGAPDLEAHGGYTFCGLASLVMLGKAECCDLDNLLRWSLGRQMRYEGGFQGRTNKLVDGCYSFWVGAIFPILQAIISKTEPTMDAIKVPLFDRVALQEYVLLCCQWPAGGLLDKPGKAPDIYHTCYTLSGIAISQHSANTMDPFILGESKNEVLPTHPVYNVPPAAVMKALIFFASENSSKSSKAEIFEVDDETEGETSQMEAEPESIFSNCEDEEIESTDSSKP